MDYVKTNILVERESMQSLKKLLIDRRLSMSRWVRDKIAEELSNQAIMEELAASENLQEDRK